MEKTLVRMQCVMSDEPAAQAPLAPFGLCYRAGVRDRVPPTARLVAAFVCVVAGAGRATATEPELESLVVGPSTCPRPELVLAELATLLPPDRLSTRLRALTGRARRSS